MKLNYAGTRERLSSLAVGFRQIADGAVQARAAETLATGVRKAVSAILWRHVETGLASGLTRVDAVGPLVRVHDMPPANGGAWSDRSYVGLQPFWPFARGRLPISLMRTAERILARELVLALGGSAPAEAVELAAEGSGRGKAPAGGTPRRRRKGLPACAPKS